MKMENIKNKKCIQNITTIMNHSFMSQLALCTAALLINPGVSDYCCCDYWGQAHLD